MLVFSRNRPIQLHGLLHSLQQKATGMGTLSVLHCYDEKYKPALDEVRHLFPSVQWIQEADFRLDVQGVLESSGPVVGFLVDDNFLRRSVNLQACAGRLLESPEVLAFSLRMGLNLEHCYMIDRPQPLPDGFVRKGLFHWDWRQAVYDWAYPLSLDGHLFRTEHVLSWTTGIPFRKPNTLEAMIQAALSRPELPPLCSCFPESVLIGIPLNRVQDEFKANRSMNCSPEQLLELWNNGYCMDAQRLSSVLPRSAHLPIQVPFQRRIE